MAEIDDEVLSTRSTTTGTPMKVVVVYITGDQRASQNSNLVDDHETTVMASALMLRLW
jgi:hypothetical protein